MRVGLHIAVALLFLLLLWLTGGLNYLSNLNDSPEAVKGTVLVAILAVLLGLIYFYDRFFMNLVTAKYGRDPHQLHWSQRLNRDGAPFCPDCGSIYMYRPDSGLDDQYVRCGDCGFAIAPLGEMRPFFEQRSKHIFGQSDSGTS